jgi:hypothetical protein
MGWELIHHNHGFAASMSGFLPQNHSAELLFLERLWTIRG